MESSGDCRSEDVDEGTPALAAWAQLTYACTHEAHRSSETEAQRRPRACRW